MMPQLLTLRVKRPDGRPLRIWVPVLPVVLLLAPIVVLVAVGAIVACVIFSINATQALGSGWRFISALPGTRFDIEQGGTAVLVTIR